MSAKIHPRILVILIFGLSAEILDLGSPAVSWYSVILTPIIGLTEE